VISENHIFGLSRLKAILDFSQKQGGNIA
jgi:hypothetical protein